MAEECSTYHKIDNMEVEEIDITLAQQHFYTNNKYNKTMIPITNEDKGSVEP